MKRSVHRWVLGLIYILAVAMIWIAASFVVQSVVGAGVSPFIITYICNSLFLIYIPIVEIGRYLEDSCSRKVLFWRNKDVQSQKCEDSEDTVLLEGHDFNMNLYNSSSHIVGHGEIMGPEFGSVRESSLHDNLKLDQKGRWTRTGVAKISLLICPLWFFAQLSFNLSLKYTTITSNTIMSSSSNIFTFLMSIIFLREKFTWVNFSSVLLCMGGTIIVSLGDSKTGLSVKASKPILGNMLALLSAGFYAAYVTLIRKKLPDDDDGQYGQFSMAHFLGFIGLFNVLFFSPVALVLYFTRIEHFNAVSWKQLGLIVGKGLLDNVLSDYLWAKAMLLTSTTVATSGLTIQIPLAVIVDLVIGKPPHLMNYIGAIVVTLGLAGINLPSSSDVSISEQPNIELERGSYDSNDQNCASSSTHENI